MKRSYKWALLLAVALLVCEKSILAITHTQIITVAGHSMEPTLKQWHQLLVSTAVESYKPKLGDVIVFDNDGYRYVKRIVALPGEEVSWYAWDGGYGDLINPTQVRQARLSLERHPESGYVKTIRIPAGQVFVAGDNRDDSVDSRSFGPVPLSQVSGLAVYPAMAAVPLYGTVH